MQNREIVRFSNDGLYDFKPYILPDVFEQLLIAQDYEKLQLVCAGVLVDDKPMGAAIAQLLENNEIYLQSIIVDEEVQRQGIGTALLNGILGEALPMFASDNDIEAMPTRIFLHTHYVLPKEEVASFDNFLKKFGFAEIYEMEDCCYIDGTKLNIPADFKKPQNIISFSEDANGNDEELEAFFRVNKIDFDSNHAFILTDGKKSKAVIYAESGVDDEYFVGAYAVAEISDKEFEDLFFSLATAIKKDTPNFYFAIDEHEITNPQHLEKIAAGSLELFAHKEAGYYADFVNEKE